MYIYKYNIYEKKYYRYDTDYIDSFSPMFDETIHQNELTPYNLHSTICQYCNTEFESRTKLFYHLKYMNIDTVNKNGRNYDSEKDEYKSELGEIGIEIKNSKKNSKFFRKYRIWVRKLRFKKKIEKNNIDKLIKLFKNHFLSIHLKNLIPTG